MKKTIGILGLILVLIVAGGGYYTYKLQHRTTYANILPHELTVGNTAVLWPHLEDLPAADIQERLNQLLQQEFDRLAETAAKEPQTTIQANYLVSFNKGNITSLSITESVYPYHAAHPMSYLKAYTVNIKTGQLYQLDDLFKADSGYRERLNALIQEQLTQRKIFFITHYDGIKETGQEFYLTPTALVIYYQLYEYTPYVYGFLKFTIPFGQITDILTPELRQAVQLNQTGS